MFNLVTGQNTSLSDTTLFFCLNLKVLQPNASCLKMAEL